MEPLRGGSLAENLPEGVEETFKQVNSERLPADWALRWLWNHESVSIVISGMTEMKQVVENLKTADEAKINSMSQDELEAIEQVTRIMKEKVKVGCTTCGYCMPCPVGVNIPECFSLYNDFFRYDSLSSKNHAKMMYFGMLGEQERADKCVECGQCEGHCPQEISIIKTLKKAHETLKF